MTYRIRPVTTKMALEEALCGRTDLNKGRFAYVTCTLPKGHDGECQETLPDVGRLLRSDTKASSEDGGS